MAGGTPRAHRVVRSLNGEMEKALSRESAFLAAVLCLTPNTYYGVVRRGLVTAQKEDNEEDGKRNAEEPQEAITSGAASLVREVFNRFHAKESGRP